MTEEHLERNYRQRSGSSGLVSFTVTENETDLFISAGSDLAGEARRLVQKAREEIMAYGVRNPEFLTSLAPLPCPDNASALIRKMHMAAEKAGVGPMAAVAGAIAEYTGRGLQGHTQEVIVENGGDIYMASMEPRTVRIFTGNEKFRDHIQIVIRKELFPLGICTSSGRIGPSLSFGLADAATVLAPSAALADAAATALGNLVRREDDIPKALERAQQIDGVTGALIIIGGTLGAWGDLELSAP